MIQMLWPMALVILSNTIYQVCAKEIPGNVSPFASLTVTYLVGAIITAILHCVTQPGAGLLKEVARMNWAPFVLGLVIVGLEVGWIYAYRAGWQVSTGMIVQCTFLTVVLIFVGFFLYQEAITWNKLVGTAICLIGLAVLNLK